MALRWGLSLLLVFFTYQRLVAPQLPSTSRLVLEQLERYSR